MQIADAQQEVRRVFLGGFVGQLASWLPWTVSAVLAAWSTPRLAIIVLVIGGFFIFPATQAGLRLIGRPAAGRARISSASSGCGSLSPCR